MCSSGGHPLTTGQALASPPLQHSHGCLWHHPDGCWLFQPVAPWNTQCWTSRLHWTEVSWCQWKQHELFSLHYTVINTCVACYVFEIEKRQKHQRGANAVMKKRMRNYKFEYKLHCCNRSNSKNILGGTD